MLSRPYADVISAVSLAVYIAIALNVALPLIDNETGWRMAFGKIAALVENGH
jgi:hypothetical protein